MNNKTIATRFAAGATTGRNQKGSLFIEGDTIYSYGHHFPVARRNPDGTVWLNPRKYSCTTSRHQQLVRRALAVAGVPFETAASLVVTNYSLAPGQVGEPIGNPRVENFPTGIEALRACLAKINEPEEGEGIERILVRLTDGRELPLDAAYEAITGQPPKGAKSDRRRYPLL